MKYLPVLVCIRSTVILVNTYLEGMSTILSLLTPDYRIISNLRMVSVAMGMSDTELNQILCYECQLGSLYTVAYLQLVSTFLADKGSIDSIPLG
jgi:hypothetical protein